MRSIDVWRLTWLIAASSGLLSFQILSRLPLVSLLRVEVSKSLYTWFYLIGALHSIGILWIAVFYQDKPAVQKALHFAHPISNQDDNNIIALQPHTIAFLTLFSIHTTRRCLESFLITEFGKAKMHASIFFVGIYHYIATVLSVLFDPDSITSHELTTSRTMMSGLGIMIFIMASYHQSYCNYLLAQQKRANNMNHVIPRGDWFNLVRSPLYTTEIMLYIGFILVTGCTTTILYFVSIWVVINQILLAQISSKWTETKFRDQIEKLPKWNLVPYVW